MYNTLKNNKNNFLHFLHKVVGSQVLLGVYCLKCFGLQCCNLLKKSKTRYNINEGKNKKDTRKAVDFSNSSCIMYSQFWKLMLVSCMWI